MPHPYLLLLRKSEEEPERERESRQAIPKLSASKPAAEVG